MQVPWGAGALDAIIECWRRKAPPWRPPFELGTQHLIRRPHQLMGIL